MEIKDVTLEEVQLAANISLLAAVECSMKHHLYNAQVDCLRDIRIDEDSCALCTYRKQHTGKCIDCPLYDWGQVCCKEYEEMRRCRADKNLIGFNRAAFKLYIRLTSIRDQIIKGSKIGETCQTEIKFSAIDRVTIKVGNKYKLIEKGSASDGDTFWLVQCDDCKVVLIGPDGNRWRAPVRVGGSSDISDLEFSEITGKHTFELVGKTEIEKAVTKIENRNQIRIGNKYRFAGTEYLLAICGRKNAVVLINQFEGTNWGEPIDVENTLNISEDEFRQITHGYRFELIS